MTADITTGDGPDMGRSSHSTVSFKEGYYFYFKDGDDEIVARCSAWTGMEAVYLNGDKVSEFRSLGFNSKHIFEHKGETYRMMFIITGLSKGEIECILIKGNEIIGEENNAFYPNRKKRAWWEAAGVTFVGFLAGLGVGYLAGKVVLNLIG